MSKSETKKSKYKNPDKYIAKLKSDLKRNESDIDYWMKEYHEACNELTKLKKETFGKLWFTYNEEVTHSVSFVHNPLEKSKLGSVGDEVVIIGNIIEITQSAKKKDASAVFHTHTVYLKKEKSQ